MNKSGNNPKGTGRVANGKTRDSTSRQERLAAELRANLRKRKAGSKSGKENKTR